MLAEAVQRPTMRPATASPSCRMARAGSEANLDRDRTILGKISKRDNRYLRVLFVQAAWVVLVKSETDQMGRPRAQALDRGRQEAAALQRARHRLANKLARIAWSVLAHGRAFEANKLQTTA